MGIYDSLSAVYDEFFPQNPEATKFLLGLAKMPVLSTKSDSAHNGETNTDYANNDNKKNQTLRRALDLGCATGSQALDLAAAGWTILGYEPCFTMLKLAQAKAAARGLPAVFEPLGMLDIQGRIEDKSQDKSQDLVLCLGNTLPYLSGLAELKLFLEYIKRILAPSGALVLQLLNYAKVEDAMAREGFVFPEIEAAGYHFLRHYEARDDGRLDFVTRLIPPGDSTKAAADGRDPLFPIRPRLLLELLSEAGLSRTQSFSGWNAGPFNESQDSYLIVVARLG